MANIFTTNNTGDYRISATTTSTYYNDSVTLAGKRIHIGEYMNIEYVVDTNGIVIPLSDIKSVSFKQYNDPEGLMSALSEEGYNEGTSLFIKDKEGIVHLIDFNGPYNRHNFEFVSTYDSDLKKKVFLYQFSHMKNKA